MGSATFFLTAFDSAMNVVLTGAHSRNENSEFADGAAIFTPFDHMSS